MSDEQQSEQLSFEQAVEQIEEILDQVESGEAGLEQSIGHYERGMALIKRCKGILDSAEKRIAELSEAASGELVIDGEAVADDDDEADDA